MGSFIADEFEFVEKLCSAEKTCAEKMMEILSTVCLPILTLI